MSVPASATLPCELSDAFRKTNGRKRLGREIDGTSCGRLEAVEGKACDLANARLAGNQPCPIVTLADAERRQQIPAGHDRCRSAALIARTLILLHCGR